MQILINLDLSSKGFVSLFFGLFPMECLAFCSNFVGRFWPF